MEKNSNIEEAQATFSRRIELTESQVAVVLDDKDVMVNLPQDIITGERETIGQHFIIAIGIKEKLSSDKEFVQDMTNYAKTVLAVDELEDN